MKGGPAASARPSSVWAAPRTLKEATALSYALISAVSSHTSESSLCGGHRPRYRRSTAPLPPPGPPGAHLPGAPSEQHPVRHAAPPPRGRLLRTRTIVTSGAPQRAVAAVAAGGPRRSARAPRSGCGTGAAPRGDQRGRRAVWERPRDASGRRRCRPVGGYLSRGTCLEDPGKREREPGPSTKTLLTSHHLQVSHWHNLPRFPSGSP